MASILLPVPRIQSNLTVLPLRRKLEIAQLKQKIAKALEDTATLDAGVEKTVTVSPPPPPPPPPPSPPPQSRKLGKPGKPRKAGTPVGKTHYIGYYASDGQPTATFLTPEKKRLSLSVGARYGKYRVKRITPASVTLERGKKKWVLHMDEGDYRIANGTGITPSMAEFVATPSGGSGGSWWIWAWFWWFWWFWWNGRAEANAAQQWRIFSDQSDPHRRAVLPDGRITKTGAHDVL